MFFVRLRPGLMIALALVAGAARAAPAIAFNVPGVVQPLKQSGDTCWATTATMLVGWQRQQSLPIATLMTEAGPAFSNLYAARKGLPRSQKAEFLKRLGLREIPPACYTPAGFLALMKAKGALWVTVDSSTAGFTHAVIVTGLAGDGTGGGTRVLFVDPASGTEKTLGFDAFQKKFESGAGKADIQVVAAE